MTSAQVQVQPQKQTLDLLQVEDYDSSAEGIKERAKEIARKAIKHDIWGFQMAFSFADSYFTAKQISEWEDIMEKAIRSKKNGGIVKIKV